MNRLPNFNTDHMTSHNSTRLPKKREKHRGPPGQMSSDINVSIESEFESPLPKLTDIATSLNELNDALTVGKPKPPKYLCEIQNRRFNQPSMLNMDTRYVRNVSIGVGLRQIGPHCALYVPIVRYHPYSNSSKRDERPRTRSENNDEAGPSTSQQQHPVVSRHDDYSVEELAEVSQLGGALKKSRSLENIAAECCVNFETESKPLEMELVSDCIERLKVD